MAGPSTAHRDARTDAAGRGEEPHDRPGARPDRRRQHQPVQAGRGPQSRLKIPLIFGLDVIHGYKTMFPVPIGEASSWDPATVQARRGRVGRSEATADGIKWTFNPMVDIAATRAGDEWSRAPARTRSWRSAIAAAKLRGYQGTDFSAANKMRGDVKHFAAYGAPDSPAANTTPSTCPPEQLYNDYRRRTKPRSTPAPRR